MSTQLIYGQISKVMADISAIGKDRKNEAQRFNFRGIDDVYNELHAKLAEHKVFTVPEVLDYAREERATKSGGVSTHVIMTMRYTFFAEDGSSIAATVKGEAADTADKATNKAMSVAHKYCFLQIFSIPTKESSENDPDAQNPEFASRGPQKAPPPPPRPSAKPGSTWTPPQDDGWAPPEAYDRPAASNRPTARGATK